MYVLYVLTSVRIVAPQSSEAHSSYLSEESRQLAARIAAAQAELQSLTAGVRRSINATGPARTSSEQLPAAETVSQKEERILAPSVQLHTQ